MSKVRVPTDIYDYLPQILDAVSDAIVVVDVNPAPHLVWINKLASEILQINPREWLGKTRDEYVDGLVDRSIITSCG